MVQVQGDQVLKNNSIAYYKTVNKLADYYCLVPLECVAHYDSYHSQELMQIHQCIAYTEVETS